MALSDNQRRFVEEYLKDLNATQAYLRAGYKCTESAARRCAHKLLTNADIQAQIAEAQRQRSERTQVTNDRVLLEIARLAFNDPRKVFDDQGNLLPVKDWPDEVAAAISSIKVTEVKSDDDTTTQLKEVKFWDKGKQIELAGKHLGMFTDKVDLTGNVKLVLDHLDAKL